MGCKWGKHNWQISHTNKANSFRCTRCGQLASGVATFRKSKIKPAVAISVVIIGVIIGGYIFQTPQTLQTMENEAKNIITNTGNTVQQLSSQVAKATLNGLNYNTAQNNAPNSSPSNPQSQDTSKSITYSDCTVASNGLGLYRINCLNHDSVSCNSDPAMPSGIHKNAILTMNGNDCNVEYVDNTGKKITWNLSLSSSTTNNAQTQNTPNNSVSTPTQTCAEGFKKLPDGTCVLNKPFVPPPQPVEPTPVQSPDLQPIIKIPDLEQKIHLLINQQRQENGLSSLSFDAKLTSIARAHSTDMATRNFFSHANPDNQDPTARALQAGYTCHKNLPNGYYVDGIAENIFQNNLYNSAETMNGVIISHDWNDMDALASSTVQGWMGSTGHRENILTSTYDREGIGVAIASDDKVYITEDFC